MKSTDYKTSGRYVAVRDIREDEPRYLIVDMVTREVIASSYVPDSIVQIARELNSEDLNFDPLTLPHSWLEV